MREVVVEAHVASADPNEIFARIEDFEAYPRIANAVRSVRVTRESAAGPLRSEWEVTFRNGLLRWEEEDRVDRDSRVVRFDQVAGDLEAFYGEWSVDPRAGGAAIRFEAAFDLGIPSLAEMLEPVAERALRENIAELIEAFARPRAAVLAAPPLR